MGVELTSDLTWIIHTSNITDKANKILNLLRRHLYNCSTEVKSRAFTSLVRPHLEYTSSVWDPYLKQEINQLEKVQRKGVRFVCGKYQYTESVISMLTELGWKSLQQRRKKPQIDQFLQCHIPTYTSYNSWLRSDSNTFHQNSWSSTYSATGKLRAVQEQFYSTYHQRLEFITTRTCTRQNCRRVQLLSTTSHSGLTDTADLLFLIVNMIHGSFNRHHLMMSSACDALSPRQ